MVLQKVSLPGILALSFTLLSGCVQPEHMVRLNSPPQGEAIQRCQLAEFWAYHNDQGMLADMSIADPHFVAHSAMLSGAGEARLERYAELLAETGGKLNYDTGLRDQDLALARLTAANQFLAQAIPSDKTIQVVLGMSGGRGMSASELAGGQAVAKQPEPRGTAYDLGGRSEAGG